jgi:hypothetical protein
MLCLASITLAEAVGWTLFCLIVLLWAVLAWADNNPTPR